MWKHVSRRIRDSIENTYQFFDKRSTYQCSSSNNGGGGAGDQSQQHNESYRNLHVSDTDTKQQNKSPITGIGASVTRKSQYGFGYFDEDTWKQYSSSSDKNDFKERIRYDKFTHCSQRFIEALTWSTAIICGWYTSQLLCLVRRNRHPQTNFVLKQNEHQHKNYCKKYSRLFHRHSTSFYNSFFSQWVYATPNQRHKSIGPTKNSFAEYHTNTHHDDQQITNKNRFKNDYVFIAKRPLNVGARRETPIDADNIVDSVPKADSLNKWKGRNALRDRFRTNIQNVEDIIVVQMQMESKPFPINNTLDTVDSKARQYEHWITEAVSDDEDEIYVAQGGECKIDPLDVAVNNLLTVVGDIEFKLGVQNIQIDGQAKTGFLNFHLAASHEHVGAIFNLGVCYELGTGTKKNMNLALECYKLAGSMGHAKALYNVGVFYAHGYGGLEQDRKKAVEYFMAAAKIDKENTLMRLFGNKMDKSFTTNDNDVDAVKENVRKKETSKYTDDEIKETPNHLFHRDLLHYHNKNINNLIGI